MQASGWQWTVEAVDQFVYLGSAINSDGRSTQEIHRRIGTASGIMGRLSNACMAAIQTQPGNQAESLQLACPVCSPVRM